MGERPRPLIKMNEGMCLSWFGLRCEMRIILKRGCESPSETRRPLGFKHPVRLYLPRSKAEHYLHHMGEKVLASFPVQATIHFYNDDSDTEEEEEEDDELMSCGSESENTAETERLFWKQ
ncbi:protein ripply3 isoform X2 [Chiloscyllium plagiosum]|uniref:protein ripply3 isoform X2 n=1 Tax=Chiloscyllium plagiosum TaxID=36176 RepID=UPI001CB82A57|nr:protein ripply3 isoform X2 [Chiloscyllium plagiosum]